MKGLILAVIAFFFLALPVYLFDTLVMPSINSLQYTYSHADQIANRAAGVGVAN